MYVKLKGNEGMNEWMNEVVAVKTKPAGDKWGKDAV